MKESKCSAPKAGKKSDALKGVSGLPSPSKPAKWRNRDYSKSPKK